MLTYDRLSKEINIDDHPLETGLTGTISITPVPWIVRLWGRVWHLLLTVPRGPVIW